MSERKMESIRSCLIKEKTDPNVVGSRITSFFLSFLVAYLRAEGN